MVVVVEEDFSVVVPALGAGGLTTVVLFSIFFSGAGAGLMIVVFSSFFSPPGGFTIVVSPSFFSPGTTTVVSLPSPPPAGVSMRCSHAPQSEAAISTNKYFFMVGFGRLVIEVPTLLLLSELAMQLIVSVQHTVRYSRDPRIRRDSLRTTP